MTWEGTKKISFFGFYAYMQSSKKSIGNIQKILNPVLILESSSKIWKALITDIYLKIVCLFNSSSFLNLSILPCI